MANPGQNDVGVVFTITIVENGSSVDISTATSKIFVFVRPDGTAFQKAASFSSNGSDGKLRYTTLSGDLNQAGTWQLQAIVTMPSGGPYHSEPYVLTVNPDLGASLNL